MTTYVFCLESSVNFSHSVYSIIENKGPAQVIIILSNPLATSIIITVFSNDGSATGKT